MAGFGGRRRRKCLPRHPAAAAANARRRGADAPRPQGLAQRPLLPGRRLGAGATGDPFRGRAGGRRRAVHRAHSGWPSRRSGSTRAPFSPARTRVGRRPCGRGCAAASCAWRRLRRASSGRAATARRRPALCRRVLEIEPVAEEILVELLRALIAGGLDRPGHGHPARVGGLFQRLLGRPCSPALWRLIES